MCACFRVCLCVIWGEQRFTLVCALLWRFSLLNKSQTPSILKGLPSRDKAMRLLNRWESLQRAFLYFGFNFFIGKEARNEKSWGLLHFGRGGVTVPCSWKGSTGGYTFANTQVKISYQSFGCLTHNRVSEYLGVNIGNPQVLVEIACDSFLENISRPEPLPWEESMMLQDMTMGTLGSLCPQKLFKK